METSYLKTLELDKIIARAAEGCVCREAKAQMLALEPQCDPDEVRYSLEQTDAINSLLIKNGSPRFGGVEGVSQLVTRAVKGGVLSMGELLVRFLGSRGAADRRPVLRAGPAARPGAADLQRHSGTGCHG